LCEQRVSSSESSISSVLALATTGNSRAGIGRLLGYDEHGLFRNDPGIAPRLGARAAGSGFVAAVFVAAAGGLLLEDVLDVDNLLVEGAGLAAVMGKARAAAVVDREAVLVVKRLAAAASDARDDVDERTAKIKAKGSHGLSLPVTAAIRRNARAAGSTRRIRWTRRKRATDRSQLGSSTSVLRWQP